MKKKILIIFTILVVIFIVVVIYLNNTYIEVGTIIPTPNQMIDNKTYVFYSYSISNSRIIKKNEDGKIIIQGRLNKEDFNRLESIIKKEIDNKQQINLDSYTQGSYIKLKGKAYWISNDFRLKLQNFIISNKIN